MLHARALVEIDEQVPSGILEIQKLIFALGMWEGFLQEMTVELLCQEGGREHGEGKTVQVKGKMFIKAPGCERS